MNQRFADLIPEQHLDLRGLPPGSAKTDALEAAYDEGFTGCFLPTDDGPAGRIARWDRDEFRDVAGKNSYRFLDWIHQTTDDDTSEGYVASKDAFETWQRDKDAAAVDWLFGCQQNSGICVGSSGVEMLQCLLGTRAADPACGEVFRWLAGQYAYAFRSGCGQGWTMGSHASVTMDHGYCLALPDVAGFAYAGEDDSEKLVTSKWCGGRVPSAVQSFVDSQGWRFEQGAITQFDGGVDALKAMFRAKGQLHHGSNQTSGSSTPNVIKRIGGHAQTCFGGDWSDRTLEFFEQQGIHYTEADFPCAHHQTWGGGWSGAVADRYWPEWWGPKPQGAWITRASQVIQYFSEGYVYLPKLKGTPGTTPPVPSPTYQITLDGPIYADNGGPIRGTVTAKSGEATERFIIVPNGTGQYVFARRTI